jgi:hypothetical protein
MNVRSRNFGDGVGNEQQSRRIVVPLKCKEDTMRNLVLTLAAAAALGIAAPAVTSTPASAETVIIKKRGHDHGWRRSFNRADKVVIIKKRGYGHFHHGRGHGYGHRHHGHFDR